MLPPPEELPDQAPRLSDGRYVLLARIGRGGMAGVYAAWDVGEDEWRAIKVLLPKHARDKGLRSRFQREGETMKALRHPNLVRVHEVGDSEKLPFLVMELIDAGSLYRWTKTYGAMPPRLVTEAMVQLCAGLAAVHAAGVVHRDIKPRNVLVNWDGVLKLTDFGIAQLDRSQETRTGLAMGTLGFMSPEQLHDAKSVDPRTDIYAIGATMWTQLTGRKARDLFRLEDRPELMDGVPDLVRPLLSRCLAYEREDRYPSARALSRALVELLERLPPDPEHTPPLPLQLSLSFRTRPESTFSEILSTLHPEERGGTGDSSGARSDWVGEEGSAPSTPPAEPRVTHRARLTPSVPPSATPSPAPAARATTSSPPRKASAFDSRTDSSEPLPAYLVGVQQRAEVRRPETIRVTRDVRTAKERSGAWWLAQVALALALAPVALTAGVALVLGVVVGAGYWQVSMGTAALRQSQEALSNEVRDEAGLRGDLVALGADMGPLEDAFRRWESADEEPERSDAALEYLLLAEQEAKRLVRLDAPSHEEALVQQRLERLRARRSALLAAEQGWSEAAESPPGRLARGLGLAP